MVSGVFAGDVCVTSFTRLATSANGFVRFCKIINRRTNLKDLAMQDNAEDVEKGVRYSVNTYFRLKFIEPSAIIFLVEKKLLTLNLSSR